MANNAVGLQVYHCFDWHNALVHIRIPLLL